jgi:hypothetical protein
MRELTKREFLELSLKGAMILTAGGLVGLPRLSDAQSIPPYLSSSERNVLRAMAARLIPQDTDPGFLELGLGSLMETMMRVTLDVRPLIPQGLKGVDELAQAQFNKKGFTDLTLQQQDKLLRSLEAGTASGEAWKNHTSSRFFAVVRMFTVGLYYSNPMAQRMIAYPGPGQPHGHFDYAELNWSF